MLLRFTPAQERFVINERQRFNATQVALASQMVVNGQAAGDMLIGNASPIPREAWARWDAEAVSLNRSRLAVFNELATPDLTTEIDIGVLVNYFGTVGDSNEATVTMDGREDGKADQAEIAYVGTPVPIIKSPFRFGWRQMAAMRRSGNMTLETATSANATRKVAEKVEDLFLNGDTSVVVGGATIYGLRNFPQRNTGSHGFTLASATGAQWVSVIASVVSKLIADKVFDKVTIFVNYSDWFYASQTDFAAGYPKTILARLLEIPGIEKIVPAGSVPANEVLGVVKRRDLITTLSAMPMVTRPKSRPDPEDDYKFDVITAVAPQLKYDADGNSGIVHLSQ